MNAREIHTTAQEAASCTVPSPEGKALVALRDLLVHFLDATDTGCPESMKAMSIDQVRLLNQMHLAVGL